MPFCLGRIPQLIPLPGKCKLQHALNGHRALLLRFSLRERLPIAPPQRFRPFSPGAGVEFPAEHSVKRIVVEPRRFVAAECLKICPLIGERRRIQGVIEKISCSLLK